LRPGWIERRWISTMGRLRLRSKESRDRHGERAKAADQVEYEIGRDGASPHHDLVDIDDERPGL
jgi:hypothetical protein